MKSIELIRDEPVIRLKPADAERFARLRLRMLQNAPWAFGADADSDEAIDPARVAKALGEEHNVILAVEDSATRELIAAAGIVRQKQPKFAHRARIWGVYVDPAHRGKSLGRMVVTGVVQLGRSWPGVDFLDLAVNENSKAALRLYQSLGFKEWGREPETVAHEGRRYDEIYMTLRLERGGG